MKWTITHSILTGYLILVLLLVGANALLSLRLTSLDEYGAGEVHTPKLDAISRMLDKLRAQVSNERSCILIAPDVWIKQKADMARKEFSEELEKIDELGWDVHDYAVLSRIKRLYSSIDSLTTMAQVHAFEDTQEGKAAADWIYRTEIEPRQAELESLFWQLMDAEGRLEQIKRARYLVGRSLVSVTLVAVLLGIAVALITAAQVAKPLHQLTQATKILGEGRLGYQVNVGSEDAVGVLARAFNEMSLRLEKLDQFRSELISNVSHELRTPLVSIQEAASLLWDGVPGSLNDRQKHLLDIIRNNQQRLKKLIEDLLDISRLEAEEVQLQLEKTDMKPLMEECVKTIEPLAEQRKIGIKIEAPEKLSQIWIDQERIKQAVINLLSNAVKFTPEGGRVTVQLGENDGELRCDVIDTGPGIPSDELEVIFDKFYQIRRRKHEKTEGTGLGLAISRGIISMHGGRIWASSTLGEGATFSFLLSKQHPEHIESEDIYGERQNTHCR